MTLARQFAIALAIAVLYPALVHWSVRAVYPYPDRPSESGTFVYAYSMPNSVQEVRAIEAKMRAEAERRWEEARRQDALYDKLTLPFRHALIQVASPLGLVAIVLGSYLTLHAIGTGLIVGGFASIANAYWGYWAHLDDWSRSVALLGGFCLLIFVAYRQVVSARSQPG